MRYEAQLTPSEIAIMKDSQDDPSLFSDYFFRPTGETQGFRFDHKFTEEGAWQKKVTLAKQKDITVIGGFGTGKTLGIAIGACYWTVLTRDFKFLNVAPKAWQAKQMYDLILLNARNTRFEDLIWEKPRKPHPRIVIRYKIGKVLYESSLEFMSADKDATGILSWEGDWLHIDESGLLDNLEEVIINVGSRLRGTVRGRERLGRFSMTSNSWDNYYLWYYFDLAVGDPQNFLSIVVSSRHNKNITEDQLAKMLMRIPKDERNRFIEGSRPEGRGRFFDKESIYQCESVILAEDLEDRAGSNKPGYEIEKAYGAGVVYMKTKPKRGRLYMIFGDPGIGKFPFRNAPVLMVWDCTEFPRLPARLVAFWWGNGNGRITPFVTRMDKFMDDYQPLYTGIDSTGPQKNVAELINEQFYRNKLEDMGLDEDTQIAIVPKKIAGMDFSGQKKVRYLQALRLLIEAGLLLWPKNIIGIRSQLANYDLEKDKAIAQDIVATMSMSAHAIRTYFHVDPQELLDQIHEKPHKITHGPRRSSPADRSKRSSRSRKTEPIPH